MAKMADTVQYRQLQEKPVILNEDKLIQLLIEKVATISMCCIATGIF
jgi:hypothetical protein